MEPKIIQQEDLTITGMVFYGDPFQSKEGWSKENEIGKLWNKFNKIEAAQNLKPETVYEIHIDAISEEDYPETKNFYVFIGTETKHFKEIPCEFFTKEFPAGEYAVFTGKGKQMFDTIDFIYKKWLVTNSVYELPYPILFQGYTKRFKGMDNEESEIDFIIPVKKVKE